MNNEGIELKDLAQQRAISKRESKKLEVILFTLWGNQTDVMRGVKVAARWGVLP
jgi:hypothetical protein